MKCHSWRSESETGAAWNEGFGLGAVELNSAVSFRRRRKVGDGAIAREGRMRNFSSNVVVGCTVRMAVSLMNRLYITYLTAGVTVYALTPLTQSP